MGLRDILDAQKKQKELANGKTSQPVLQSEPQKTTEPSTAQPGPASLGQQQIKKSSILDKLKKPAGNEPIASTNATTPVVEQSRQVKENVELTSSANTELQQRTSAQSVEAKIAAEIQQEMPPSKPLTLQEKMKLRMQGNGQVQNTHTAPGVVDPKNSLAEAKKVQQVEQPKVSEPAKEFSASQAADASKSNDGTVNVEELRHNLAYLANNIENKELVKDVVGTIARQIKNNPELFPHMTRGDMNLMVRGLRMSYQVKVMAKQEKKESKKKNDSATAEIAAMMKDAGIDFSGLKF